MLEKKLSDLPKKKLKDWKERKQCAWLWRKHNELRGRKLSD